MLVPTNWYRLIVNKECGGKLGFLKVRKFPQMHGQPHCLPYEAKKKSSSSKRDNSLEGEETLNGYASNW